MRTIRGKRGPRSAGAEKGAATLEALIILPFFFIVWGCLWFAHRMGEQKLVLHDVVRSCAWEQMVSGCTAPPSPRCSYPATPQLADENLEGSRQALLNIEDRSLRFSVDLKAMFGANFRPMIATEKSTTVRRPPVAGGGAGQVRAAYTAMCNDVRGGETTLQVATQSYCRLTGWCQ